jgi:error-prone DNA polymerase
MRLGLRFVKGLRQEAGDRIETEQAKRPFASIEDLVRRCDLRESEATSLAELGALAELEGNRRSASSAASRRSRRSALWQVARAVRPASPLFAGDEADEPSPLLEMSPLEETAADYRLAEITTGPHPMSYYRSLLDRYGVVPAAELPKRRPDERVRAAGSVIVRQRPGTAKGLLFLTLEDETGMCQAVVMPDLFREHRTTIVAAAGLIVEGVLQMRDGSLSVKADRFWPIERLEPVPSHDFR